MIVDLPATTTEVVSKKLVSVRDSGGAVTLGRVLTLIVCADEGEPTEGAIEAANAASREHPCRLIVVSRGNREAATRLDAQIRVGGDAGASEVVVLRLYGELAEHAESVVMPFLLPDTPVVTWWPGEAPATPSQDPIGRLGTRRITDATKATDLDSVLAGRLAGYAPGDSDLAWSQITYWRAILTSGLDRPPHEPVVRAVVSGPAQSPAIDLLAGWLRAQLGVSTERTIGSFEVRLERASGTLVLAVDQNNNAVLTNPGKPDGKVAMIARGVRDHIAEELRRLDPDEIYHLALQGVAEVTVVPS
ncbi:glucose-6-phosphate dehydrogenase assembly protein OpcA [Williamsia sp. CHRR-6]|uniref:glucose-6-phosphate dehydrogenase assembly protein OpcA n=1 Tax=Williamsia sp. CHRR-6 TaxID=2835871 RepID=UPI001BD9DE5B|nr:glucose-6-phosphate dehydrogenase assembly protein OpcA [Williamsia sp. CHRR-6]MBT0568040.1 glucose-6-phosphate dehydrogenase assembly protein OpcA [Williamsia sp. CHRR-6]